VKYRDLGVDYDNVTLIDGTPTANQNIEYNKFAVFHPLTTIWKKLLHAITHVHPYYDYRPLSENDYLLYL